ncbi:MAG: hypothetical protein AB8C84_08215 [Oligoflexales bacterium]
MKIWFFTCIIFFYFVLGVESRDSYAAVNDDAVVEITKIEKKQRLVYLKVDLMDGYEKGKRVCFFKKTNELSLKSQKKKKKRKKKNGKKKRKKKRKKKKKEKRIACGTIVKVDLKKNTVRVKVGKKKIKKVKKNMIARLKGAGRAGALAYDHGLKFYWLPYAASTVSYNRLVYTIPSGTETARENLWDIQGNTSQGLVGGGFEYVMMSWNLGFGAKFKQDLEWVSETDYDRADKTQYVSHLQSSTAVGGWLVYYLMNNDFKLGLGVDYESATATLKSIWTNDTKSFETTLYEITSPLSVVSLRVPMQYDIYVDPLGISIGVHGIVPLSVSGSPSVSVSDLNGSNTSIYSGSDVEADIIESLAHKKSSFGVDIVLGIFFGF